MTIRIDHDTAVHLLQQLANERPDYVYTNPNGERADSRPGAVNCVYFTPEGAPSCIVGHVVAQLGVTAEQVGERNTATVAGLFIDLEVEAEVRTIGMLRNAQTRQDRGVPWGQAVSSAISYTEAAIRTGMVRP